jgi:hypothetical protein
MAIIYGLFDPRIEPNVIRYVGYTQYTAEFRLIQHLTEAKKKRKSHRHHWLNSLTDDGIRPGILILEEVSEENWQEREQYWIEHYADTVVNGTIGGDGLVNPTQEVRDRIAASLRGQNLGNQYRKGIPHSEEVRRKLSESLRNSEKVKAAGLAKRGIDPHQNLTQEQIAARNEKIRQAKLGKKRTPFSEETKERMREAHTGTKLPTASAKKLGSRFINDGIEMKQLKAGEPLPDGWVYGMIKKPKLED